MDDKNLSYSFDHKAVQVIKEIERNAKRAEFNQNILASPYFNNPNSTSAQLAIESGKASSFTSSGGGSSPATPNAASSSAFSGVTSPTPTIASVTNSATVAQILYGLDGWLEFSHYTVTSGSAPTNEYITQSVAGDFVGNLFVTEGAAIFSDGTTVVYSNDTSQTLATIAQRAKSNQLGIWYPSWNGTGTAPTSSFTFPLALDSSGNPLDYTNINISYDLLVSKLTVGVNGALFNSNAVSSETLEVLSLNINNGTIMNGSMVEDKRSMMATIGSIAEHERKGVLKLGLLYDPSLTTDYATPDPTNQNIKFLNLPSDPPALRAYDAANGTNFYLKADNDYIHGRYAHRELFERKLEEYRQSEFVRLSIPAHEPLITTGTPDPIPGVVSGNGIVVSILNPTGNPSTWLKGQYPSLVISSDPTHKNNGTGPDRIGTIDFTFPSTTTPDTALSIAAPLQCAGKVVNLTIVANSTDRAAAASFEGANFVVRLPKEFQVDMTNGLNTISHEHHYDLRTVTTTYNADGTTTTTTSDTDAITTGGLWNGVDGIVVQFPTQLKEVPPSGVITLQWVILN